MAFCPYCGKQIEAGEVCSCTTGAAQQAAPSYIGAPRPAAPRPAAPRPAAPGSAAPESAAPASAGAYPAPAAAAQQSAYAPLPEERPARPMSADPVSREDRYYAPQREEDYFGDREDYFGARNDSYAPQNGAAPMADESYAPRADVRRPSAAAQPSAFVRDLKELLARVTKLFSGKSDEALRESVESESTGWMVVFGAYVLFGTLAACFAVPRFISDAAGDLLGDLLGGLIKLSYGDVLSASFGGMLWRSLLVNIFTLGIILAAVLIICKVNKSSLPFTGVLNLVGIAFVPAAALNVLGFLFSFFFPVGTMLCGIVSAVCTVVIVLTALADHSGRRGLWTNVIAVCAILVVYILLTWLLMSGFLPEMLEVDQPDFGDFSSWF